MFDDIHWPLIAAVNSAETELRLLESRGWTSEQHQRKIMLARIEASRASARLDGWRDGICAASGMEKGYLIMRGDELFWANGGDPNVGICGGCLVEFPEQD